MPGRAPLALLAAPLAGAGPAFARPRELVAVKPRANITVPPTVVADPRSLQAR